MINLERVKDVLTNKGWKCNYALMWGDKINENTLYAHSPRMDGKYNASAFVVNKHDSQPRLDGGVATRGALLTDEIFNDIVLIRDVVRMCKE